MAGAFYIELSADQWLCAASHREKDAKIFRWLFQRLSRLRSARRSRFWTASWYIKFSAPCDALFIAVILNIRPACVGAHADRRMLEEENLMSNDMLIGVLYVLIGLLHLFHTV